MQLTSAVMFIACSVPLAFLFGVAVLWKRANKNEDVYFDYIAKRYGK